MVCPFIKQCTKTVSFYYYQDYCAGPWEYYRCNEFTTIAERQVSPKTWDEIVEG